MEKNIVERNNATNNTQAETSETMAMLVDEHNSTPRPYATDLDDENDTMESIAPDNRTTREILMQKMAAANLLIASEVAKALVCPSIGFGKRDGFAGYYP